MEQENLRQWLINEVEQRHLSYREFARRAGVSHSTLSLFLSGEMRLGYRTCLAIARAASEQPARVLGMAELLPMPLTEEEDRTTRELTEIMRRLDPLRRKDLIEIARLQLRLQREEGDLRKVDDQMLPDGPST